MRHVEVNEMKSGRAVLKCYNDNIWTVAWRPAGMVSFGHRHGLVYEGYDHVKARIAFDDLIRWAENMEKEHA